MRATDLCITRWFQRGENTSGRGGELMFLIRGEGKGSEALLNLDGQVERVPFAYFLSQSKEFRLNARYSSVYQNEKLKIQVKTIVTEVPEGTGSMPFRVEIDFRQHAG